jgi:ribonucleoside-diphosphate reductase alpha chain
MDSKVSLHLSENALKVLEKRYLGKDEKGVVRENPEQMFRRIADAIAGVNAQPSEREFLSEEYYRFMASLDFLPNSPTIMNAGRPLGQLSACFVLPVGDSMPEIFDTVKATALIHQTGGGTGFAFSRLRPKGAVVRSTGGQASGPVSFMKVINASTDAIKQGGCLHPSTLVYTENGVQRLDELVDPNGSEWQTITESVVTDKGWHTAYEGHVHGVSETLEVTFSNGSRLVGTLEHKVLVSENGQNVWREFRELKAGDLVMLSLGTKPFSKDAVVLKPSQELGIGFPSVLDEEFAYWLGYLYGDGFVSKTGQKKVGWTVVDSHPDLKRELVHLSECLFGLNVSSQKKPNDASETFVINSVALHEWLGINGFDKERFRQIEVPAAIRRSPFPVIAAFIRGYFEADGSLNEGHPIVTSTSRDFLEVMQTLLLGGGIYSVLRHKSFRTEDRSGDQPVYTLEIRTAESLRNFNQTIGWKRGILSGGINGDAKEEQQNILHVAVESVVPAGQNLTLDLSVDERHAYVANGVITHNTRRGANMGILRVDHPDILEFIDCKMDLTQVTNFNISVAVTDAFMKALKEDGEYDLVAPHNGEVVGRLSAKLVFDKIAHNAWANGEPGLFFIDTANRYNPTPSRWSYEATNPCGEQVLGPYESCNLGSINLERHVKTDVKGAPVVDWDKLGHSVYLSVRFLDNVVDANRFPIPELATVNQGARRIGLGIMGFARLLMLLEIPYDSEEGLEMAEKIMSFIHDEAERTSQDLAKVHGPFPYFEGVGTRKRNSHLLTIAPTGTISMIADTSSGCEPEFSIIWYKNVMDGTHLPYTLDLFTRVAEREGFMTPDLAEKIVENHGSCRGLREVPEKWQKVFATAHDVSPEWHVRMQAAFQKYIDAAVSKTINMPPEATVEDVEKAYLLSHDLGCKGITVYRDGSRHNQVLNLTKGETGTVASRDLKWGERRVPLDMSRGIRAKIKGKSGKSYVHLYFDEENRPAEIFVTPAADHRERESAILFGRLGSMALQFGAPIEEVIGQFIKSHEEAGTLGSDPYSIAKAIGMVLSKEGGDGYANGLALEVACPSCSGKVAFLEGCLKCVGGEKGGSCGWSQC